MAYLTVTTPVDVVAPGDGKLSLREAITQANGSSGPDTIVFAANIEGTTLTLTQGELAVTQDLTIDGDKDNNGSAVTIDGNLSSRILNISGSGTDVELLDITLARGRSPVDENGGAVLLGGGSLIMRGATIQDSVADSAAGGGIAASSGSRLTLTSSTIIGNDGSGRRYLSRQCMVRIVGSHISSNGAYYYGGGVWRWHKHLQ